MNSSRLKFLILNLLSCFEEEEVKQIKKRGISIKLRRWEGRISSGDTDVIIVDTDFGRIDIEQIKRLPKTIVIALSGSRCSPMTPQKLLEKGFNQLLFKPLTIDDLNKIAEFLLDKKTNKNNDPEQSNEL